MSFPARGTMSKETAQQLVAAVEAQRAEEPLLSEAALCINAGTTLSRYQYAQNVLTGSAKHPPRRAPQPEEEDDTEEPSESGILQELAPELAGVRVFIVQGGVAEVAAILRHFIET